MINYRGTGYYRKKRVKVSNTMRLRCFFAARLTRKSTDVEKVKIAGVYSTVVSTK